MFRSHSMQNLINDIQEVIAPTSSAEIDMTPRWYDRLHRATQFGVHRHEPTRNMRIVLETFDPIFNPTKDFYFVACYRGIKPLAGYLIANTFWDEFMKDFGNDYLSQYCQGTINPEEEIKRLVTGLNTMNYPNRDRDYIRSKNINTYLQRSLEQELVEWESFWEMVQDTGFTLSHQRTQNELCFDLYPQWPFGRDLEVGLMYQAEYPAFVYNEVNIRNPMVDLVTKGYVPFIGTYHALYPEAEHDNEYTPEEFAELYPNFKKGF